MSISINRRPRGMTMIELMVASGLSAVIFALFLQALVDVHRFYRKVSAQSRQVGSALIILDRIEGMCFGLPRQAFSKVPGPDGGEMLVIQPFSTLAASGTEVYSSKRYVLQNTSDGVYLWEIAGEATGLGSVLSKFPPDPEQTRKSRLLEAGWRFEAEFAGGNFPLRLLLLPPNGGPPYRRSVEGFH